MTADRREHLQVPREVNLINLKDVEMELCQITGQTMIENIKVLRTGIYTIYLNAKRTTFAS
jgi:hypothetical protein